MPTQLQAIPGAFFPPDPEKKGHFFVRCLGLWASLSLLLTASQMVAGKTGSSSSFQCTSPLEKSHIYVFFPTPMVPRILNTRTLYKKCHSLSVYLCGMKHPRCPYTCYSLTRGRRGAWGPPTVIAAIVAWACTVICACVLRLRLQPCPTTPQCLHYVSHFIVPS